MIRRIRNYFILHRINSTEDVFEKAKINLVYDFTFFMSVLALPFIIQLWINHYYYHLLINIFEISVLILIYVLFRSNISTRRIAIVFVIMDSIMSAGSLILQNGNFDIQATLWSILLIIYTFLLLGKKWGLGIVAFIILLFAGCTDLTGNGALLNFGLDSSQVVPTAVPFLIFPLLLNTYIITTFINTHISAEKIILLQKNQLEEQKTEILASINYAKKIQLAILPLEETIKNKIPDSFIYYQPKDIVSGDFYWFHEINPDQYIMVCADCTGHGVPGALMTVIGSNLLNQIIVEKKEYQPRVILQKLDNLISYTLKQNNKSADYVPDGMDLSLIKVDHQKKEITFSAAKRTGFLIRDNKISEIKGNKHSLGGTKEETSVFNEEIIPYKKNDILYLFTDGIADQFGGPFQKKFLTKQLKELLLKIHIHPINEQGKMIGEAIRQWTGSQEQTDDISILGIQF